MIFLRRWKELAIAVLVLFAAYSFRASIREAEARGRAEAGLAVAQAKAARDSARADSADRAHTVDTLRLTRWRTRYDTARITDTVIRDSVVYVRLDVADSTITACGKALDSCELAKAARDSVIASLRFQLDATESLKQPKAGFKTGALVGAGLTALAVWLAGGLAR